MRTALSSTPEMIWPRIRAGSQLPQQSWLKSHLRLRSRRLHSQLSADWFGSWEHTANWWRHTCRFLPALHLVRSKSIMATWSANCAAVKPADSTAWSVAVDKQDYSWFVLYAGWAAASSTSSMEERAKNMFHLSNQTGNEVQVFGWIRSPSEHIVRVCVLDFNFWCPKRHWLQQIVFIQLLLCSISIFSFCSSLTWLSWRFCCWWTSSSAWGFCGSRGSCWGCHRGGWFDIPTKIESAGTFCMTISSTISGKGWFTWSSTVRGCSASNSLLSAAQSWLRLCCWPRRLPRRGCSCCTGREGGSGLRVDHLKSGLLDLVGVDWCSLVLALLGNFGQNGC